MWKSMGAKAAVGLVGICPKKIGWILILFGLLAIPTAQLHAVIIRGVDTSTTSAPADDPGWYNLGNTANGLSCVYLGNGWVLTAAHCRVADSSEKATFNGVTYNLVGTSIRLHEDGNSSLIDLSLYQISAQPPGLSSLSISSATPANGSTVTGMGFGRDRVSTLTYWNSSWVEIPAPPAAYTGYKWGSARPKRWGKNQITDSGYTINVGWGDDYIIKTTFDKTGGSGDDEFQASVGDSGGALFYKTPADVWTLAGILEAIGTYSGQPSSTAVFDNYTYSIDLSYYRDQIVSAVQVFQFTGTLNNPNATIGSGWQKSQLLGNGGFGNLTGACSIPVDFNNHQFTFQSGASNINYSGTLFGAGDLIIQGGDPNSYAITLSGTSANTYTGSTQVQSGLLVLGKTAGIAALSGSQITIDSGAILRTDASQQITASTPLNLQGGEFNLNSQDQTIGTLSGTSGAIKLGSGILVVNQTAAATFSGQISGAGQFEKNGAEILTLTGSNSYSNKTTISAGVLRLSNTAALPGGTGGTGGTSALVINGGVVGLGVSDFARALGTGSNQVQFLASGGFAAYDADRAVNLGGNSTPGEVAWGSGSFVPDGSALVLSATTADKTLDFQNPINLGSSTRTIQVDNGTANEDARLSGILRGSGGGLIKTGAGLLILNAANTYSGATTISAGTLQIGNGGITGTLGTNSVTNNSTLVFNRSNSVVLLNPIGGSGSLQQIGAGTLILYASNTYSGSTTISNGTLQVGVGGSFGALGTGPVTNNGTLTFHRGDTFTISNNIGGSGILRKIGAGTLILNSSNTYSGPTTISNGTLQIGNGGITGTLGTGSITITNNSTLVFNRSNGVVVSNPISGSGSLRQIGAGILTLSGTNNYSGTTTISNGILQLANPSALGSTVGGTIVQNGGALDLNGLTVGNELLTITGSGSNGNGALVNNNTSTTAVLDGAVTLGGNAGTGGAGDLTLGGAMNYGSFAFTKNGDGILTLTGSQNWGDNASTTVLSGTLSYQQADGATTTVGASNPTLHIAPDAVVQVNSFYHDPFTDDTTPTEHVQIVNDSTGGFILSAGTTTVAGISGAGSTTVTDGAILNSSYIYQNTLTIGAGSKVVLSPRSGLNDPFGLKFRALSAKAILDLPALESAFIPPPDTAAGYLPSGDISSDTILDSDSTVGVFGGFILVPEPSTYVLLLLAGMIALGRFIWKRKS